MSAEGRLLHLPFQADPLDRLARHLIEHHAGALPDLRRVVVLLPRPAGAGRLRRLLALRAEGAGHPALLPPRITTLAAWTLAAYDPPAPVLGPAARQALLHEVLRDHPELCGDQNRWALTLSLLALFDELAVSRHGLSLDRPPVAQLAEAYGAAGEPPQGLAQEAGLLHRAWRAWEEAVAGRGRLDAGAAYREALAASVAPARDTDIYLAGHLELSDAEVEWLRAVLPAGRLTLVIQGAGRAGGLHPLAPLGRWQDRTGLALGRTPTTDLERFLEATYRPVNDAGTPPLRQRARECAGALGGDPLDGRLATLAAADPEAEAQAVSLAVRRWWHAGCRHIGIVTNDRRLARRVRALLERAGIQIQDAAGWRLSTTSAAAALHRWLDCLERDFPADALLDLLKSPFLAAERQAGALALLESELLEGQQIPGGLDRLQGALDGLDGAALEPRYGPGAGAALARWLGELAEAAAPVTALGPGAHPLGALLAACREGLQRCGLWAGLAADPAGVRLLELFEDLEAAAREAGTRQSWGEFRAWLEGQWEQANFQPPLAGTGVELMGFAEARLYCFDALVIAGASAEHLPGNPGGDTFFNDRVRKALGLPTRTARRSLLFYDFYRLLQAAPRVLVTRHREREGEPVPPSPWLERLEVFHRLAFDTGLADRSLAAWLDDPRTRLRPAGDPGRGAPPGRPAPCLPPPRVPERLSASAFQRLVDCPYRFFGQDGLGLAPPPVRDEARERADYGTAVHRILHAFTAGADDLPGPFPGPWDPAHRPRARALLLEIAAAVWADMPRRHLLARAWPHRFERSVDDYLDWEFERRADWPTVEAEQTGERALPGTGLRLYGRLDRLDRRADGVAIVDYKTGDPPGAQDILGGESVQLPFYGLLPEPRPLAVGVLGIRPPGRKKPFTELRGEPLAAVLARTEARLKHLAAALSGGAGLPALGDEGACGRCHLQGLCRRGHWQEAPDPP